MITYIEAQQILQSIRRTAETEVVPLQKATGNILATDAISDMYMPPFDKSAMDGYACRRCDISASLRVIEIVSAGSMPKLPITKGTCAKIMTGAPVPSGADCVFLVEHSQENADGTVSCLQIPSKSNICKKGEDTAPGDILIKRGQLLKPEHIPVLAAIGMSNVSVAKPPTVGLFASGSEIVDVSQLPVGAQIRDSNRPMIMALLAAIGVGANDYGIVSDNKAELGQIIETSAVENDITICTGGVSMGDFDLMPQLLQDSGFELVFADLAIQPGKPVKVFQRNGHVVFALSGNPVSSFIQYHLLAKPFLLSTEFVNAHNYKILTVMPFTYSRKKIGRTAFVPIHIKADGEIESVEFHGSAHIFAFAKANALLEIPADCATVKVGDSVTIWPL